MMIFFVLSLAVKYVDNVDMFNLRLVSKKCTFHNFNYIICISYWATHLLEIIDSEFMKVQCENYPLSLNVNLTNCKDSDVVDKLCANKTAMKNLYDLDLSCSTIHNVKRFSEVPVLNLSYSSINDSDTLGIIDCSKLKCKYRDRGELHVHIDMLCLHATKVSNVSALGNVKWLDLSETKVSNIYPLGVVDCEYDNCAFQNKQLHVHIKELYLRQTSVKHVSILGNVRVLDLSKTCVIDVSALGNVHNLSLQGNCCVSDVSMLGNVKMLNLDQASSVYDVSMLGNVEYLNLSYTHVMDISALKHVKKLDITGCRSLTDVSMLENEYLIAWLLPQFTALDFSKVKRLEGFA